MNTIHSAYSVTETVNDNGYTTRIVKPHSLNQWATSMESTVNALVKDVERMVNHDKAIADLAKRVDGMRDFADYIATNYPAIIQEYLVAGQAKHRMDITGDEPVTMGP